MKAELLYWCFEHHAQLVFKGSYVREPLKKLLRDAGWVPEPNPRERLKNPRPVDWTDIFLPQDEIGLPRPEEFQALITSLRDVQKSFPSLQIKEPRQVSFRELQTYGKEKDEYDS